MQSLREKFLAKPVPQNLMHKGIAMVDDKDDKIGEFYIVGSSSLAGLKPASQSVPQPQLQSPLPVFVLENCS